MQVLLENTFCTIAAHSSDIVPQVVARAGATCAKRELHLASRVAAQAGLETATQISCFCSGRYSNGREEISSFLSACARQKNLLPAMNTLVAQFEIPEDIIQAQWLIGFDGVGFGFRFRTQQSFEFVGSFRNRRQPLK